MGTKEKFMGRCQKLAVSPSEAAEILGIGMPKVYDLVHTDGFPAVKVGRRWLIPLEALNDWLIEQSKKNNHDLKTE